MPDAVVKSVFDIALDPSAEAAADDAADAEIDAALGVPHDRVRAWLLKLAKGERPPPPSA